MSARGTIKATRLEPETGRLQYLVEQSTGIAEWRYASDPKFVSEFGDLVKKYIAEPSHREERRRRLLAPQGEEKQQQQASPKSTSSVVKRIKADAGSTSSETGSVSGGQVRLPVGQFRQARIHTPSKLARAKKGEFDEADENARYSLNGLGLLVRKVPEKRPLSPAVSESGAKKVAKKVPESQPVSLPTSAASSPKPSSKVPSQKTRAPVSLQEMMRRKILLARTQQIQREQQRHLLNGLVRSAANRLKPVSINISPSTHPLQDAIIRSSVVPSPRRRNRVPPSTVPRQSGYTSPPNSVSHVRYQTHQAAIQSFLSQPDNYSNAEAPSEASASTSSTSNNGQQYFSVRRGPRRQAASGQMSQLRYSQIVLRHRPGWTQLWLFTTTRMQNAMNPTVCEELSAALKACIADNDTSLILISSSGPTFSSGVDLDYLLDAKDPASAGQRLSQSITELCNVMLTCPKPIFVAVNGLCVGFGVALCCLADVAIATEKAIFHTPYAQLGHVPEGGLSTTLQNTVGRSLASDMLITGRRLTAIEALRAGLVSRVLWPTNFVQELIVRLDVVAANCSQPALEATKFLMRSATSNGDDTVISHENTDKLPRSAAILRAIEAESELLELFWTSPESRTAMRRYVDTV